MEPASVRIKFNGALFTLMLGWYQAVLSDLTCKPLDSESLENETTYFNCSSSVTAKEIHWYHYPVGVEAHQRKSVYAYGKFYKDYEEDFALDKNLSYGAYNLVIKYVKPDYAGRYECQDDGGLGNSCSAQLIVLDDEPLCKSDINPHGVVGNNACGIQPDELHLSCSISYHGNIVPSLEWTTLGKNDSIGGNVTKGQLHGRFTHNLTIKADLVEDRSAFECQITKSRSSKHNCTSEIVKLLHIYNASSVFIQNVGDDVNCSANTSSQTCLYKWKWYNKTDSLTVSNSQALKVNETGLHRCEATCDLRNIQCTVNASVINATLKSENNGSETTSGSSSNAALLGVLLSLLFIAIILLLILLWMRRRRNSKRKDETRVEGGMNNGVKDNSTREQLLLKKGASESDPILISDNEEDSVIDETEIREAEHQEKRKKTEESRNEGFYFDLPVLLHIQSLNSGPDEKASISAPNERNSISGLAVLNKELFIAFEQKSEVKVFQAISFSPLRSIMVIDLDSALDMVSSPVDRSLYISSSKEIFEIDTNGRVIRKWPVEDGGGTLSVTRDKTVLLSVWKRTALREYSADGELICEVRLPPGVRPFHSVKTDVDQFVVSYEHGMAHGVAKFNMNGTIVQSFSGMLKFPKYLAVNIDECIFVADQKNSRVLMLSPTLDPSKAILLDNNKFGRPSRICMDEENSRMFVADILADNPRFMVFELQNHKAGSNRGITVNHDRPLGTSPNLKHDPGEIVEVISDNVSGNDEEEEEDEFLDAVGPADESRGEKRKR